MPAGRPRRSCWSSTGWKPCCAPSTGSRPPPSARPGPAAGGGPGAGIVTVFATPRPAGVPAVIEAAVAGRLVLNQSDPVGAAVFGVRGAVGLPPGRAVQMPGGRRVQLAVPGARLMGQAGDADPSGDPPPSVDVLPGDVPSEQVEALLAIGPDRWTLPIGVADHDLAPVGIDLVPGDHIVVVGGARRRQDDAARRPRRRRRPTGARGPGGRRRVVVAAPRRGGGLRQRDRAGRVVRRSDRGRAAGPGPRRRRRRRARHRDRRAGGRASSPPACRGDLADPR